VSDANADISKRLSPQLTINNLPGGVGVFEFGKNFKATYLSKGISNLFGYSDFEFQNCMELGLDTMVIPSEQLHLKSVLTEAKKTLAEIDLELRPLRNNGAKWIRLQGKFSRFQDENPVYYFVASDISCAKENSLKLEQQNAKLNLVFANSTFEMWEVNLTNLHVTTLTKTILGGHDPMEFDNPIQFLTENNLIHTDFIPSLEDDFKALTEGFGSESILKFRCMDNEFRFLKVSYTFVNSESTDNNCAIGIFQDVDDEIEARLSSLGDDFLFFIAFDMENGKPILADKNSRSILGSDMNLFSIYQAMIETYMHPDDISLLASIGTVEKLREFGKNGKREFSFEGRILSPRNRFEGYHWCSFSFSFSNSMTRTNTALFLGIKDIHTKKNHELELINRAQRDSLTGLLNRYSLEGLVNKAIQNSLNNNMLAGLCIIDIDNFKAINDSFGHDFGDEVLRSVAKTLKAIFPNPSFIARLGGDELLVCIPLLETENQAYQQGLAICKQVSEKLISERTVSCSVGVSVSPMHGKSYMELYQNADLALYRAKQQGRNNCCIFDGVKNFPRSGQWINHEWLLDSLEEMVFLCDVKTNEMIFLNKIGRTLLGNPGNYLGSKCYEILFGIQEKCLCCKQDSLSYDEWLVFEPQGGWKGIPYRFKEKLISWNGRPAMLCIAFNLEKEKNIPRNSTISRYLVENEEILSFIEMASLASWDFEIPSGKFSYTFNRKRKRQNGSFLISSDKKKEVSIVHPEDQYAFFTFLNRQKLSPDGESLTIRLRFDEQDAFAFHRISSFGFANTTGEIVRIGGTLTRLSVDPSSNSLLPFIVNEIPLPIAFISYKRGNPLLFANDRFFAFFGYDREVYEKDFSNNGFALIHFSDFSELQQNLDDCITQEKTRLKQSLRMRTNDRGYIWIQATMGITYGCGNPLIHLYLQEKKLDQNIEISSIFKNLQDFVETFPLGIGVFSISGAKIQYKFANLELSNLLGYNEQALIVMEHSNPMGIFLSEEASQVKEKILTAKWPEPPEDFRSKLIKKDGTEIFVNLMFKYFEHFDEETFFYIVFNEVTPFNEFVDKKIQAVEKLEYSLSHCLLTGLYTRQRFFDETERMLSFNKDQRYVMVCWNIERFAIINELLGLEVGNQVLKTLGTKIRDYIADKGTFSRLEADHFAACLPQELCNPDELQEKINLEGLMKELNFSISLVFGLYVIEDTTMPVPLMCDRATLALKSTKGNYLKNYAFYKETLSTSRMDEQTIISEMKDALKNGEFCFYLQPIYFLEKGTISSAEALVRWNHPQKGILNPNEFIPVFERFGFITTLDLYIWDMVCQYLAEELKNGRNPVPISVNLSRIDLCDRNLSKLLIETAKLYNVPAKLLELEVTETAYMENPSQMKDLVKILQDYGFTILMDDFGTGYSSLNMLNTIPMDIVKVDQNFLHSLNSDERSSKILETIVSLGKALRFPIIAEGVETEEQLKYLKSIGCDHVQGFYYSKPLTPNAFRILNDSMQNQIDS
jgi:diguanylate cyclase (GGDEF)-like protein